MAGKRQVIEAGMKRINRWHGQWLLIAAVLGLSVGGSGQWADRRPQSFPPAIALPHGPSPGGGVVLGSMGWAGSGRANRAEPDAGLWPEAGADGRYRVIDASRYDRQLQREHELVLCQGHRVLWRFGEQLREEALDSIRWSAVGGVVGRTVGTAVKTARQAVRLAHNADKSETILVRHYTDIATRQSINESSHLRAGTYVTLPSEIPPRGGHLQIERILEINPGRGVTYIDVPTPVSNLRVPADGPMTSGGAWQRQLIEPTPIDPHRWRRPPGRRGGGG